MKVQIVLYGPGGELDRQTIETHHSDTVADEIVEALKAWTLSPGDTIKIEEIEVREQQDDTPCIEWNGWNHPGDY